MNKSSWVILAGVLIVVVGGAAGLLAVAIFATVDAPPQDEPLRVEGPGMNWEDVPPSPPPKSMPAPALRGVETPTDANLARRLGALEAEVKSLRAQLAAERARTTPFVEMLEKAKDGGMLVPGDTPFADGGPGMLDDHAMPGTPAYAAKLASDLGLDAGRAKAFKASYETFLSKVEALEKDHATVTRDGDTTTITIKPFGQAGNQVRREWDDYVDSTLSAEEKQGYDKRAARNQLIGGRGGEKTRTIKIKEAGGTVRISEESDDGTGGQMQQVMEGPAMARDMMLKDYAHLLK